MYDDIRDPEKQNEAADMIVAYGNGAITRSNFVRRGLALGLTSGTIFSVLEGALGSSVAGAQTARGEHVDAGTPLAKLQKLVYPAGIHSDPTYHGPNGNSHVGLLPRGAHGGKDQHGIWKWNFQNFVADKPYRIALSHFSAKWDLMVESVARFERMAKKCGFEVTAFDNNFDANQAIQNAQLIAQQKFDFCIMEQIYPAANTTIARTLRNAGVPAIFFAVPGPSGAQFLDPGNFRMFFDIGKWVGNYAKHTWDGQVDLAILAAQPRAGTYVAQREVGFKAGIKSVLPKTPNSVFKTIDSQGLLDISQTKTTDLLTSNPKAKYIIGSGTNDDAGVGIVRALEAAGRTQHAAIGSQAGQASAVEELKKRSSPLKVSAFQDVETQTWMASIGILKLMGGKVGSVNLYPYWLTTHATVDAFPPQAGTLA
jgi:ABC-type sugar transport system substrate-binding protein